MDYFLAGDDHPLANKPNGQAGVQPQPVTKPHNKPTIWQRTSLVQGSNGTLALCVLFSLILAVPDLCCIITRSLVESFGGVLGPLLAKIGGASCILILANTMFSTTSAEPAGRKDMGVCPVVVCWITYSILHLCCLLILDVEIQVWRRSVFEPFGHPFCWNFSLGNDPKRTSHQPLSLFNLNLIQWC